MRRIILALPMLLATGAAIAQTEESDAPRRWSNSTELGIVVTTGNSDSQTIGLKDTLTRRWEISRFQLKLDGTLVNKADDTYAIVDCLGVDPQTCLNDLVANPPSDPNDVPYVVVRPEIEPDVEKYFVEATYDHQIHDRLFWNVGASWLRDIDAGIINRYVVFGGLGNVWYDREDLHFSTTYGLSYTDRQEENPDPDKDETFPGVRFAWEYSNLWGKVTTFSNDWSFNVNLSDAKDFSTTMTNGLSVEMSKRLALKVSWTILYNNEPALEDIDLFFGDGQQIEIGEIQIRKERTDTVFNTSLVVNF